MEKKSPNLVFERRDDDEIMDARIVVWQKKNYFIEGDKK